MECIGKNKFLRLNLTHRDIEYDRACDFHLRITFFWSYCKYCDLIGAVGHKFAIYASKWYYLKSIQ